MPRQRFEFKSAKKEKIKNDTLEELALRVKALEEAIFKENKGAFAIETVGDTDDRI